MLSGFAMIVIGVWLTAQAIGGNLAGRIRSWAGGATGGEDPSSSSSGDGSSSSSSPKSGGVGSGGGARVK